MSNPEPYKLAVKTIVKSKANLFKLIPLKSVVAGEMFDISFQFQNKSNDNFPGGKFNYMIEWPSGQLVTDDFTIPSLRKNEVYKSDPSQTEALCDGFGLVFVNDKIPWSVRDEQNRDRRVNFYKWNREEEIIPRASAGYIKVKRSEEIYEFWAMIISAASLFIIALEKVIHFLSWLSTQTS